MIKEFETEDRFQAACHTWLWNTYQQTRRCFFHVANELQKMKGESTKAYMIRLAKHLAKGAVPGTHDNIFIWAGKVYTIELKLPNGTISDEQIAFAEAVREQGAIVYYCWTMEQFQKTIKKIMQL